MKVIPPNFGYVEEGIFRCGAPEARHYGFLASLGLRTCVLLTDTHDGAFVHWLQETGVMIFCPLSSEARPRATVGGGPQPRYGVRDGAASAIAPSTVAGGSRSHGNGNNGRDDGREGSASPNSGLWGGFSPGSRPEPIEVGASTNREGDGGADGGEGSLDGTGKQSGDGAYNAQRTATTNGGAGLNASRSGWGNQTNNGATTSGTSNAVRFLQENVVDRQMSMRFSPVLAQEPMYFPGGVRYGGGGDYTIGSPCQIVSAPSYEGRLHGLMTLSEAVVVSILHILLDPQYYPLLITCSKGRYRTGIVCGCLRKLQGWNLVSILEEYRRFAGNKSRADNEEFIELFDEELVNLELSGGRRPTILYDV